MKKQIIAIHGADAFATYEEYIEYLKRETVDLNRGRGWKNSLPETLGEEYEVILPRMPNSMNAKYLEWKIWLEKFTPFMRDGVVLLGHSMGGVFLAKFLSEKTIPVQVRATFLVAAPYDADGERELVEFAVSGSLEGLARQGGEIFLYQSKDDPVVAFSELAKYQAVLPSAQVQVFEDRGHFNQEEFPEIVEAIKAL